MNRFFAVLIMVVVSHGVQAQTQEKFTEHLTGLITQLATLTGLAGQCGEQLDYYGKDAVAGKECAEFNKQFYALWPGRDQLREEIAELIRVVESGEQPCDDICTSQVQRIEELRVTVTYFLDYFDFWKES